MRPTPSETISGVRRILKEVIEPDLQTEYARTRLREIRAVLAQVDWDDAVLRLRRSDEVVRALLAEIQGWADAQPDSTPELEGLRGKVVPKNEEPSQTFAGLNDRYQERAARLVAASDLLAAWDRRHGGSDADCRRLRLRVIEQLGGERA
jgi:hypothetical protein